MRLVLLLANVAGMIVRSLGGSGRWTGKDNGQRLQKT